MKLTSRRLIGFVVAAACLGTIAGCAPGIPQTGESGGSGPITLRFWTNLTVDAQASVIRAQATACAVNMPNVSLDFEAIPFKDMYTKLATAFQSGNGPDIMNTNDSAVSFAQSADYLVPVDDVVDAHGRDDFLPSYLAEVQKDGKTWGVPDWANHQEVWYRKDLFQAAGITSTPTTWDELLADAKKLDQGAGGVRGFAVPMDSVQVAPQTLYQFLYANNVFTFDPKTGDYAFDKNLDAATQSVQFMLDLYHAASPAESRTWTWTDFRNAFVQGKVAMTNDFGAVVGLAQQNNPGLLDKISSFPFPTPTGAPASAMLGGGYFYMIGKTGDARQAAAKQLISCMMDPELAAGRANSRPVFALPAEISAAETDTYKSNPLVQKFASEIAAIRKVSSYRYGMEGGLNALSGQIEATTFIGDDLQKAAIGDMTAAQVVNDMNTQFKSMIAANK